MASNVHFAFFFDCHTMMCFLVRSPLLSLSLCHFLITGVVRQLPTLLREPLRILVLTKHTMAQLQFCMMVNTTSAFFSFLNVIYWLLLFNLIVSFNDETVRHRACGTFMEAAKAQGYRTALVATSRITHATPASFSSHVSYRDWEEEVGTGPPFCQRPSLMLQAVDCAATGAYSKRGYPFRRWTIFVFSR